MNLTIYDYVGWGILAALLLNWWMEAKDRRARKRAGEAEYQSWF